MRRYGAFEVASKVGKVFEQPVADAELEDVRVDEAGRVFTRAPIPPSPKAPGGTKIDPDEEGRRRVGVRVDGEIVKGWPTPSGKLEFWSRTLHEWGWPELATPTYVKSHVHQQNLDSDQIPLITTFRVPVQIHTRRVSGSLDSNAPPPFLRVSPHSEPSWSMATVIIPMRWPLCPSGFQRPIW